MNNTLGFSDRIKRLARAIGFAEGFNIAGSRPQRNHNPGDLTLDVTGKGVGKDGPFVVYATDEDGQSALEWLVTLMLTGRSTIYTPTMTIAEVSTHYTQTEQGSWAANVAGYLGVSVNTPINSV